MTQSYYMDNHIGRRVHKHVGSKWILTISDIPCYDAQSDISVYVCSRLGIHVLVRIDFSQK
jgi:hypothetical protein